METLADWAIPIALLLILIASQIFWIGRIPDLVQWFLPGRPRHPWLAAIAGLLCVFLFIYCYQEWALGHTIRASDYRLQSILFAGAFWWWVVGSLSAFVLVVAFRVLDRAARAFAWVYCRGRKVLQARPTAADSISIPSSPSRRGFLEQAAVLLSATPFAAAGYGLIYGRRNLEVVLQRIKLPRLPHAFDGFRIALLSDIHIGPFTSAEYVRRCVSVTNALTPELIALTGDYVSWDPTEQDEVVRLLAGLQVPYGVFGCLGNHEWLTETEGSITRLFAAQGIRILRQERSAVQLGGETVNLIGIDDPQDPSDVYRHLDRVRGLVMPHTVNILLTHYPQLFDHPELGIDLTLAGDMHGGGQLSLDFIHPGLNLGRLIGVPYVRGWYEKGGAQLYMNRGIGITGPPIRFGARPEITVIELTREG